MTGQKKGFKERLPVVLLPLLENIRSGLDVGNFRCLQADQFRNTCRHGFAGFDQIRLVDAFIPERIVARLYP